MRKTILGYIIALTLVTGSFSETFSMNISSSFFTDGTIKLDNLEIMLKDKFIIYEENSGAGKIKITETGDLFIDDNEIKTTAEDKILLIEFYKKTELIYQKALAIGNAGIKVGKEGAKLGGKGAMMGLKAVAGVIKMMATFDSDSFEAMMNEEAAIMDKEAAVIDKMAAKIEKKADDLEKYTLTLNKDIDQMKKSIKELSSKKWFYF